MNIDRIIRTSTAYLADMQLQNGSFRVHTSVAEIPFTIADTIDTPFCTTLLLRALSDVPHTEQIREAALRYLLSQRSESWTWNYWSNDTAMRAILPYPDDLDDTVSALTAIALTKPGLIDGRVVAHTAQHLVASEVQPGGPYRTWLVSDKLRKEWGDVDIVVNAHIGHFLMLQNVQVPGLAAFVESALATDTLTSPYYPNRIVSLYALSLWYKGVALSKLHSYIDIELQREQLNALELSLLISSSYKSNNQNHALRDQATQRLLTLQNEGHWSAAVFFKHTDRHQQLPYAGAAVLTTAYALQALSLYQNNRLHIHTDSAGAQKPPVLRPMLTGAAALPNKALRKRYREIARRTIQEDTEGQITAIATHTAYAYDIPLARSTARHLNLASLNGWIAYTIFDDFLDNQGSQSNVSVATFALRQTMQHFRAALPNHSLFQVLVDKVLNTVDAANHWEITHARTVVRDGRLHIVRLPEYHDLAQLAHKSWGHTLAASGALLASDIHASTELVHLQKFFRHFLIARQLNDDAHDWEEDLMDGRLSVCVVQLLNDTGYKTVDLRNDLPALRTVFWERTLTSITPLILSHAALARAALKETSMLRVEQFAAWLTPLEQAAHTAEHERLKTLDFIATYTKKH